MSEPAMNSIPAKTSVLQKGNGVAVETVDETVVIEPSDDKLTVMKSAVVPQTEWALRDILGLRADIANTDTPFVNVIGYTPAFDMWVNDPWVVAHSTGYKYYRGNLVVTCNLVAPGSSYGAYVVQALCDGFVNPITSGFDDSTLDDIHTSCQDVFGILNCETGNSVTLKLPFVCPFEALDFAGVWSNSPEGGNTMWRLLLWPLTPLTSTINTTALGQVTFFVHMEDLVVEVHQFQGRKHTAPFTASLEKPTKTQGKYGKMAATGAKIAAAVTNVAPFLAPFTGPLAVGLGAVSTIADIFGFTRDASPLMPSPVVNKITSTLSTIDGTDPSEVLGLMNGNSVSIDPRIGGGIGEDPMSFGDLFDRWTLIRSFGVSKSTPVGGIYNIPVTPSLPGVTLGRAFHTTAGFVGLPFAYWSGDMEYLIYIPSHTNVKGAIQVFWDPKVFATTTTAYSHDPTHMLSGTMIDLCGSSCTYLSVDMAGFTSSKFNEPVYDTGTTRTTDYCNGSLTFYLNAEVTTPRTDAAVVTVLVFARGGKNMKFHVPKQFTTYGGSVTQITPVNSTFRLQGLKVFDPTTESTTVALAPSEQVAPTVQVNFGEDIASVRGLVQKFSYAGTLILENKNDVTLPYPYASLAFPQRPDYTSGQGYGYIPDTSALGFNPAGAPGTVAQTWTWAGHYLTMFCGYRGSHRVKILHRDTGASVDDSYPLFVTAMVPNDIQAGGQLSGTYTNNTARFTHVSLQPINETTGGEYAVPYYCYQRYVSINDFNITAGLDYPYKAKTARAVLWMPAWAFKSADQQKMFDIFQAGGPDISVAHFRRVPALIIGA